MHYNDIMQEQERTKSHFFTTPELTTNRFSNSQSKLEKVLDD